MRKAVPPAHRKPNRVADRWHLLKILGEVLCLTYTQHLSQLRQCHLVYPTQPIVLDETIQTTFPAVKAVKRLRRPPSPEEQARVQRRHHWEAVFAKVHALLDAGYSHRQVAPTLHISQNTVYKYAALTTLPGKRRLNLVHDGWMATGITCETGSNRDIARQSNFIRS